MVGIKNPIIFFSIDKGLWCISLQYFKFELNSIWEIYLKGYRNY